jgi:hypothetical protein
MTEQKEKSCTQLKKIWKFIECNRWVFIGPIVAFLLWGYALSCTPQTMSPLDPTRMVNALELETDLKTWQKAQEITIIKFEAAGKDIEKQKQDNQAITQMIFDLATGGIPDMSGLAKLLLGGGGLGAVLDNIRKRGLIIGLKKTNNKAVT